MNFEVVFKNKRFFFDFNENWFYVCDEENICKFFRLEKKRKEYLQKSIERIFNF